MMTKAPRQAVTIHYRRLADATGAFGKQTLDAALRKAMQHRSDGKGIGEHWKLRAWAVPPSGEDTLLMNVHQDGADRFFGDLTLYTKGFMQTLIEEKEDMPILSVEQLPAPQGKEYVHSMMYWLAVGSHVLMIQSRSLTAKQLEEYLTWLLKERTPAITSTGQVILQAKFDPEQVGGDLDDISEIVVGGRADIHAAEHIPPDTTVESYKEVAKRTWRERSLEILRALMGNEADLEKLLKSIPDEADLEIAVRIGYKAKRKISRAPMLQALRNLPEGDIKARGPRGRLTDGDIRLSHPASILKNGSLLDPQDVVRALNEAYRAFVANGKIVPG